MATLQTIRDRAGVLVAGIIGVAILAFVLGDFFGRGNASRLGSKKRMEIGEIGGKSVSYIDFDKRVNNLTEVYKLSGKTNMDEATLQSIKNQTWDQLVRGMIMSREYERLGLNVSSDELFDLVQGENPHLYVRQLFTDKNTGVFNRSALIRFLKNMENDETGNSKKYWMFMEDQIDSDRMFTKYLTLIRQGLFVTTSQVNDALNLNSKLFDIRFILQRYATVPDSAVTVNQNDLETYYKAHKEDYRQTASRDIEYVEFDVVPSEKDRQAAEDWINDIKPDFESTDNMEPFINANSDEPYNYKNYKNGELPEVLNDFMFTSKPGAVYGPYFENGEYKLAKLGAVNYLPDSVHARHILISINQEVSVEQAKNKADSLKNLIEKGTDFALLATLNSDDKGSAQIGGDLGWFKEGMMVRPFSDACFFGKTGDIKLVQSQFGWHIIEILGQSRKSKKVQVGILTHKVQPSSTTYQNYYSQASRFAGTNNNYEKFSASFKKEGLNKHVANDIKENDRQIPGLESPRPLIRAVFLGKNKGIVLDQNNQAVFEMGDKFVIAYITGIREEGIAPLEQVKEDVALNARKKKKAELIITRLKQKIAENATLDDLANEINVKVLKANGVNFNSFAIPGAGIEPKLIGTIPELPVHTISDPIEGESGVYVVEVTSITKQERESVDDEKTTLLQMYRNKVNTEAYNALLENAHVIDKRAKFY